MEKLNISIVYILSCCLFCIPMLIVGNESVLEVGNFSEQDTDELIHPDGWETLTFSQVERHTDYELIEDDEISVVRAISDNAASGLVRRISIDPEKFPIVQWSWKISNTFEKGDAYSKQGDDYPARLYIIFDYDEKRLSWLQRMKNELYHALYGEYPPLAVLNYLWENHLPRDTLISNVFSSRVQMIVVRSGDEELNTWVEEERNIYDDYVRAFGEEPPMISAVAIMTDSDNTGENVVTHYGDIRFLKRPVP